MKEDERKIGCKNINFFELAWIKAIDLYHDVSVLLYRMCGVYLDMLMFLEMKFLLLSPVKWFCATVCVSTLKICI
jgi:hypothetical protein